MTETAKARVLRKWPNAYAKYVGLTTRFVITSDYRGFELSSYFSRERDAWRDAVRRARKS